MAMVSLLPIRTYICLDHLSTYMQLPNSLQTRSHLCQNRLGNVNLEMDENVASIRRFFCLKFTDARTKY